MRERAEQSGGWFTVESEPGVGTTVRYCVGSRVLSGGTTPPPGAGDGCGAASGGVGGVMTVRVLIADDDASMRGALGDLLSGEPGYEVVGLAADPESAIELAGIHRPDVAILDVKMPGGGGVRAAEGIRAASPATRIVALSAWDDGETMRRMRRAGASGYVVKGAAPDDIIGAIERIRRREPGRGARAAGGVSQPAATIAGSSPSHFSR